LTLWSAGEKGSKGKWAQVWVDSSGTIIPLEGELTDSAMHLRGEFIYKEGNKDLFRGAWTLLPDGQVRQFIEQSKDAGKSWSVWLDGYYVRRTD
jgi:hypothetical protein